MVTLHYTAKAQNARMIELPEEAEAQLQLRPGDEIQVSILSTTHTAPTIDSEDAEEREKARLAMLDAVCGKYSYLGVSVEDLHRERQADKEREERWVAGDE